MRQQARAKVDQKAKAEAAWREAMREHESQVIEVLLSIPEEELTKRSTAQYRFRCNRCSTIRYFECREDMRAYREIHRPRAQGHRGIDLGYRLYNCGLIPYMRKSKSGSMVQNWSIPENFPSDLREAANITTYDDVRRKVEAVRAEHEQSVNGGEVSTGEHPVDQEDSAAGDSL